MDELGAKLSGHDPAKYAILSHGSRILLPHLPCRLTSHPVRRARP
jgi:hypothetical protein